jgi:hypothetical protein
MIVPVGQGAEMARSPVAGRRQQFRDMIRDRRRVILVERPGRPALLILENEGRARDAKGARSIILAAITKRRTQGPLLSYYRLFDEVTPKHLKILEDALDLASTQAGQARLEEKTAALKTGGAAYAAAYKAYIEANPGQNAPAAREARQRLAVTREREKA